MNSKIIILQDFSEYKEENKNCIVYTFSADEFLLSDAQKIMQKAYVKEEKAVLFILHYKHYSVIAQNYMLKLLEEPPFNVFFHILVSSKNLLLPTIKSRLITTLISKKRNDYQININLKKLSLCQIAEFDVSKEDLLDFISALFKECIKQKIHLSEKMLDEFYTAYELALLNSNPKAIICSLLLGIMNERS